MNACISGWCMSRRQPIAVADIQQDPRIPADAFRPNFVRGLAMAPVGRSEPVAALGAYWSEPHLAGPGDLHRLQALADATSVALARLSPPATGARRPPRPEATAAARKRSEPGAKGAVRGAVPGVLARIRHNGLRPDAVETYVFAVLCDLVATLAREVFRATGGARARDVFHLLSCRQPWPWLAADAAAASSRPFSAASRSTTSSCRPSTGSRRWICRTPSTWVSMRARAR